MKKKVFISHSSKNADDAKKICNYLEKNDISVWIAPRDILPGKSYAAAIVEGIKEVDVILLIFTKDSYKSLPVRREIERAGSHKKKIINLRLDNTELDEEWEYLLGSIHWLDTTGVATNEILPKILDAVKANLEVPQRDKNDKNRLINSDVVEVRPFFKRKSIIATILVLILIVVAGGSLLYSKMSLKVLSVEQSEMVNETSSISTQSIESKEDNNVITQNKIQYTYGVYDGEIRDNKPHGYGTLTYFKHTRISEKDIKERYASKGQYVTGKFEDGNLIIGKLYNADGSLSQILSIGK